MRKVKGLCIKCYNHQYYLKHKAGYIRRAKEWNAEHREEQLVYHREKSRQWRIDNRERKNAYDRKYRKEHRKVK